MLERPAGSRRKDVHAQSGHDPDQRRRPDRPPSAVRIGSSAKLTNTTPDVPMELMMLRANDVPDDEINQMTYENDMRWYSPDAAGANSGGWRTPWPG
jgi:hypothetical protein